METFIFVYAFRPKTQKQYSRDMFTFLFALLVIVAFVYTIRKTPEKLVNRDQTEEWKGWMQVSESCRHEILSYDALCVLPR